jgi:gentisate 1,2-dioxygenase
MNPFTAAAFAWQTAFVFTLRSAQLWAEPAEAQARLTGYVLEKQKAFTTGAFAAGQAVLSGAGAEAVMAAAIAPSHRRVQANLRKIIRG